MTEWLLGHLLAEGSLNMNYFSIPDICSFFHTCTTLLNKYPNKKELKMYNIINSKAKESNEGWKNPVVGYRCAELGCLNALKYCREVDKKGFELYRHKRDMYIRALYAPTSEVLHYLVFVDIVQPHYRYNITRPFNGAWEDEYRTLGRIFDLQNKKDENRFPSRKRRKIIPEMFFIKAIDPSYLSYRPLRLMIAETYGPKEMQIIKEKALPFIYTKVIGPVTFIHAVIARNDKLLLYLYDEYEKKARDIMTLIYRTHELKALNYVAGLSKQYWFNVMKVAIIHSFELPVNNSFLPTSEMISELMELRTGHNPNLPMRRVIPDICSGDYLVNAIIKNGDVGIVKELYLQEEIKFTKEHLDVAVKSHNIELTQFILSKCLSLSSTNIIKSPEDSVMQYFCLTGNVQAIRRLLENGAQCSLAAAKKAFQKNHKDVLSLINHFQPSLISQLQ